MPQHQPKFTETWCSQCGTSPGPGDSGVSHCDQHRPEPRIVTSHVYPPIPFRGADWAAWYDGDEPNDDGQMAVGRGATEEAAIADLRAEWPRGRRS